VPACPSCGQDNEDHANFCLTCGTRLATPVSVERFRKTVTVIFSDVIGSTTLGEQLDPETLSHVMSDYFQAMKPVIERHGGQVAKFVGDAVMAVFGLPTLHEDDALRAVRSAGEMREALAELNQMLEAKWGVTISARTGVCTGQVAGEGLAPESNFVVGDVANVAARLQQTASAGEILLAEPTYRLVREAVRAELLPPLDLKGRAKPVTVFRLLELLPRVEPAPRRLDVGMVGRQDHLAQLQWAFRRAVEERGCRLIAVLGSAGVGKSRLAHEFLLTLADEPTVLHGRCLPYGDGITFWPLAEMVKQAAAIDERDSPEVAKAKLEAKLRPDSDAPAVAERIAQLTGLAEAQAGAEETFWAVRMLFESLAGERPLVAVFEDVHWAEPTLLELIEYLASYAAGEPILLLCLARSELTEARPGWGESRGTRTLIDLEPLNSAECDRLILAMLGEAGLVPRVRDRIAEAAEGNPLFVEQMIAMLIDEGLLLREESRWVVTGDLSAISVPDTIQALLAARLDRLEAAERAVIGRAAVVGQAFYLSALEELSPPELGPRLGGILMGLVRKGLIRPDRSDIGGEDAFRFHHLLVRDAAYAGLSKESRADLHARFAHWLEARASERVSEYGEILGYHLEQAYRYLSELGPVDEEGRKVALRAAEYLADAGWRASARWDVPAGVALRSRALVLMRDDDTRRPQLLAEVGDALLWRGRFDEAEQALAEAIELAGRAGDVRTRTLAQLSRLRLRFQVDPAADYTELEAEAERAAEMFEAAADHVGAAQAWHVAYWARFGLCRLAQAREAADRALEHARQARADYPYLDRLGLIASMLYGPTPASEALSESERIAQGMRGHLTAEAVALCFLGQIRAMLDETELAGELILQGVARRQELGDLPGASMARAEGLGYFVEMLRGNWAAAEPELRGGYEALDAIGDKNYLSTIAGWLAHCLYAQDQLDQAEEFAQICREAAAGSWVASQVLWRGASAMLLAQGGDVEEGEVLAKEAVGLALQTDRVDIQGDSLMDLAEVLRLAGRFDEAAAAVRDALGRYEEKEVLSVLPRTRRFLNELLAAAAGSPA
jgi:class 3 adenylate cyclase/tetratricopeptide (TPR) repeat protein